MATFNLELTPFLQSSDYHLIQFCIQSQHHLTRNMSSRSTRSASPCLLEIFPVEILEQIYLYSENPSFALVNKQIFQCLSSQSTRLRFCVRLFSYGGGPAPYENNERAEILRHAQTVVFQQPWFSNNFARKLQREVLRLQKVPERIVDPRRYRATRRVRVVSLTQIPRELMLQKPWGPAKVKLIHRLLKWGAVIPTRPKYIARDAMMNAIVENKYLAVNLLYEYGKVRFHHKHFQAAILVDCDRRIVEMIIESSNSQPRPFLDPFDRRIYERAMLMESAGNPMGRQILKDVLWKGNEREFRSR